MVTLFFPTFIRPSPSHFPKIQLKLRIFQEVFGGGSVLCQYNWVGLWYLEFPSIHCSKVKLIIRTFLWDLEGENEVAVIFRLLKSMWVLNTVALDLFAYLLVWVAPGSAVLLAATSSSPSACAVLWQNAPAASVYLLHHWGWKWFQFLLRGPSFFSWILFFSVSSNLSLCFLSYVHILFLYCGLAGLLPSQSQH